ncbi:MAG: acyl-CoA dehydrogenase family protein, partial [Proteobacteria bacterium]|nr:acyl-CoA dehydrogenase family protein [Pseudomonadota bacterium]
RISHNRLRQRAGSLLVVDEHPAQSDVMDYQRETRGQNFFEQDPNLLDVLGRIDANALRRWRQTISTFGAWVGNEVDIEAEHTDRHGHPVLKAYGRDGEITNEIIHNPAWQAVSRGAYERGVVGLNYGEDPAPFIITFAMGYLLSQSDVSLHCPVTMTGAVAHILDRYAPKSVSDKYLYQLIRTDGNALTAGTWATEHHGGSDVGATTTTARPDGENFRLNGLKWFVSNVDGGIGLATARPRGAAPGTAGLGLYLVPSYLDDGTRNPMRIRRLKDKLGTCGVPTGELDLIDTFAVEVAPPPEGFRLMMKALEISRIHNAMASVGLQRRAFLEMVSYATHRQAFGNTITAYPMVQDEILDSLVELEADCALAFEAARTFDAERQDPSLSPWLRLVTALAKYRTAENANVTCRRAIEVIGGNAYTYDLVTPRLLRDAQVTTVWEGPANIQALEVLRMLSNRHPGFGHFRDRVTGVLDSAPVAMDDIKSVVASSLSDCQEAVELVQQDNGLAQRHARRLLGLLADTLAAALVLEEATLEYARGDGRKVLVAERFLSRHLAPPVKRGILARADRSNDNFSKMIGYEQIDIAYITRATRATN